MYKVGPKEKRLTFLYFQEKHKLGKALQAGDEVAATKHRERASELLAAARDAEKGGE